MKRPAETEDSLHVEISFLLPCGPQGLNSGLQDSWKVALPTEPSHRPKSIL